MHSFNRDNAKVFVDGSVEKQFCLREEGIAERGGDGEEEEYIDRIGD